MSMKAMKEISTHCLIEPVDFCLQTLLFKLFKFPDNERSLVRTVNGSRVPYTKWAQKLS